MDLIKKELEIEEDCCFVYVRRRHRMVTSAKMKELWAEHSQWCIEHLGDFIKYDGSGNFFINTDEGTRVVGYKTCIEDAFIDKGLTFGMHKRVIVLFDEFLDTSYMENEIKLFQQTIANIVRNEYTQDVTIFMIGNTVSKHCPYFDFFGIDIKEIKQGQIGILRDQNGGTVAFEYCKNKVDTLGKKKTSEYFGFNHPTSRMILHGDWEYDDCNTEPLDGIFWKDNRQLIQAYITGIKNVYEMSIWESENPILFVRTVNTQNGIVNKRIKYNFSFDNSLNLTYNNYKPVPKYRKVSSFCDESVLAYLDIAKECLRCGRVIFQTIEIGTEFTMSFNGVM